MVISLPEICEGFNVTLFITKHDLAKLTISPFFFFFWTLVVLSHRVNSLMVTAAEWNYQSLVYILNTPAPTLNEVSPYLHTCFSKFRWVVNLYPINCFVCKFEIVLFKGDFWYFGVIDSWWCQGIGNMLCS